MKRTLLDHLCENKELRDVLIELLAAPDVISYMDAGRGGNQRQFMVALLLRSDLLKTLRNLQIKEDTNNEK